jgi:hypothetical protein
LFEATPATSAFAQQFSGLAIRLQREESRGIVGLTLSSDNVRGLEFRRVDAR